jgi:hypothetical protein
LDRLEERQVHQADRVVQGREDDPLPGAYRRGLRRHLHPGDQDRLARPAAGQIGGPDHAELGQQVAIELQDVLTDVEAEDVQFGRDAFGRVQVAQLASGNEAGQPIVGDRPAKKLEDLAAGRACAGPAAAHPGRRTVKHPNPGEQVPPRRPRPTILTMIVGHRR